MKNWPESTNRYIAFIDIMGFKNMVLKQTHDKLKNDLKDILKYNEIVLDFLGKKRHSIDNEYELIVKHVTFSDSVLFITKSNSYDDLKKLLASISTIQNNFLTKNIPIKGALSYGKMTSNFDLSLFFGQPLIDAYRLEEQLHYYGVILDENIEKKINYELNVGEKSEDLIKKYLHRSKVPLKSGFITHYNLKYRNISKTILLKMYNYSSGDTRKYVDNTIDMFEKINSSN